MKILNALLDAMPVGAVPVRHVMVGAHWTAVCSLACGLASTTFGDAEQGTNKVSDAGSLHTRSAQELASLVLSPNLLEASIGMAAINSLLQVDASQMAEVNASEVLVRKAPGKNIAIVGHFPFINQLRSLAKNLWVIEKDPHGDDLPETAAVEYLPRADVVALTGTSLINHTFENLIGLCAPGALVMVLGGSTPLTPLLFDFHIHFISGTLVADEQATLLSLQQGATFPQLKGIRKLTLAVSGLI